MKSLKDTFEETKGWLMLAAGGFLLWKFGGVFTALGDTATAAAEQATSTVRENAAASADKAKIKLQAPSASASDVEKYKTDAATIAQALGTAKGSWSNWFVPDKDQVFSLLKRDYSRLLLHNNHPYDQHTLKPQTAETSTSAKRKVNYHVLSVFYKEASGNDLAADLKKFLLISAYQPYIRWIL